MKHLYSIFIVLLLIHISTHAAQTAAEQKILMQSLVDEIDAAMKRGDEVNAKALAKQAYAEIPRYSQLSDAEKATALSEIDHAINPPKKESKREAALVEKERSILTTWLNNVRNIFDEKQALDLYERAKRDAATFKHLNKEEIDRILKQIEDQVKFLVPVAKSAKKLGQEEQKKEAQKNGGLRDEDAIKKAAANRAKLSAEQQTELDWRLWDLLIGINALFDLKSIEQALQNGANPNFVIYEKNKTHGIELQVYSIATQVIELLTLPEYKSLIKLLIKYGFNINSKIIITDVHHQPKGSTTLLIGGIKNYLYAASSFENLYNFISFLLDLGADPNMTDNHGNTALHLLASRQGKGFDAQQYRTLVKLFIDHGANIDAQNNIGRSALTIAIAQTKNWNLIQALMHFNASPLVGADAHNDALSTIDATIKHTKELNERAAIKGSLTNSIQDLEAFKKEFLKYVKNYREKHRKEIREATAQAMPVAQMPGVITEYLFGQEPAPEVEKE